MNRNTKYGLIYAAISIFVGGILPVVANARPGELDSQVFSGMSSLFQVLFFIPILLIERWLNHRKSEDTENELRIRSDDKFYFGKSKWKLYIIVGLSTSLIYFLYFEGLLWAGSINGGLTLKTTSIFGLLFGFLLLKERITKIQVVFAFVLFFGMVLAVTQGAFHLLELNLGVILILICAAFWMVVHTCTKPYLSNEIASSSGLLIARNSISAAVLIGSYVIIFGEQISMVLDPVNAFFYIIMGLIYGINLFCWYKMLKFLDVYFTTIIITPQIIVTSIFGVILLGELFTIYHVIGIILIIGSIIVISQQAKSKVG
ncbi:MAG: DMT family transporter [Candidatus Helarchaeota archaeon]|nr:DMT family transporter [Candidatus Helarchaeota archaeon]